MPITPTLQSHDLLLTDYAGTPVTLGLVIEKDEKGIPIFRRFPSDSLSQQQFESFSEAIFPPQYQGFITQKEWHAGFGKQEGGINGNKRYLQTFGIDASVKGLLYPCPVPVTTTNSNPTQTGYNMGFENWTTISTVDYLNNWAHIYQVAGAPYTKDTTTYQGGAASIRDSTADAFVLYQPLGVTAVDGSIFTLTIYGRATTGNATLGSRLYNAAETQLATQTDTITAGAGWVQKTFTYTFTGTVTNPILYLNYNGTINEAWLDTAVIAWTGTALTTLTFGNLIKMIDFNSNHYAITSTGVWKRTAADWAWVGGSPPGITDAFVAVSSEAGGSFLVLCRGDSLPFWLMRTDEGFIVNSESGGEGKINHGVSSGGSDYGSYSETSGYKFSALLTGTAGTTYTIGNTGYDFTKVEDHIGLPYFIKENGAFYINASGTVIEIASELRSMFNANTGKNAISWRGNGAQTLYIPAGVGGSMLAYDAGDVVNVGPDMFAERLANFTGQIVATASDDQWLYLIQDNVTKVEFLKGRYETIDGVTDFRLHPYFENAYTTVASAHVSSITAKRLYWGGGGDLPKYIPLPSAYGDPLNDTNLTFNTSGSFETSWYDLNLPRISKTYLNCTLDSTGLSATKTVTIEYQLWESQGTWTELGGSGNGIFITSPTQTKTFSINISGRKIRFRFTFTTDNTAVGYGMYQFTCRLALSPSRLDIFTARARVGNKNKLKNNGEMDKEMVYSKVAPQLHSWKSTQPLLLTYPDGQFDASDGSHNGATVEVKFMEGYPKEIPISLGTYFPTREDPESFFDLAFVSIDRSVS